MRARNRTCRSSLSRPKRRRGRCCREDGEWSAYDQGVPTDSTFISHAENREDVVLWRALHDVGEGRYLVLGAGSPNTDAVTQALYDHGWSGTAIATSTELAAQYRSQRPRDVAVTSDPSARDQGSIPIANTVEITHVLVVDDGPLARALLHAIDLTTWRPWVVLVRQPQLERPPDTEVRDHLLSSGYRSTLFNGVATFYVAPEVADQLEAALSYPACSLDQSIDVALLDLKAKLADEQKRHVDALADLIRWRTQAVTSWSALVMEEWAPVQVRQTWQDHQDVLAELDLIEGSRSWRMTAPLRAIRRRRQGLR